MNIEPAPKAPASIIDRCCPPGTPQSMYLTGEAVGYLKALTDMAAFLPASWINEHGHDKHHVALWMLEKIAVVKANR